MEDIMILGAGHSLMLSHAPDHTQDISDKYFATISESKDYSVEKFGLFGGGNNYNTFYPEADKAVFNPEQDEFIEPMFRLLSACIVSKNYLPTEFPESVLKDSMPLLLGQTVNCDHETDVANAIGAVKSVSWQNAYTENGYTIPGGINGVLKIDAKANPRIARGINMDPPSIHSNSVTVQFEWKPSHKFEKEWEFYDNLGKMMDDGTMCRRIATKIISYKETSLVYQGADPFAKMIKDGKIIHSDYAKSVYGSFSEKDQEKAAEELRKRICFSDFKSVDTMHNTSTMFNVGASPKNSPDNNPNKSMNELEKFLEQLFGEGYLTLSEGETASVELALSHLKEILDERQSLSEAKAQAEEKVTSLEGEVTSLKEANAKMEKMSTIGTSHLSEVRESAIASYKKLTGEEKVDANILALLENESTGVETLLALKATYDAQLEEKFPLHCAKCGSRDINRASSMQENTEDETKNQDPKPATELDVISQMSQNKLRK